MPGTFISYRRADTRWITGRIFDRLKSRYGSDSVFMDIDSFCPGTDFPEYLKKILDGCDVMLAIIGPHWLRDETGANVLANEDDWVRLEVGTALARKIPVIPVLIDRTEIPKARDMPESLRAL